MLKFDLKELKLNELVASNKRASKYDFLYVDKDTTKEILETIKRGVKINLIVDRLNSVITKEEDKLITISLKQHLVSIVKTKEYKEEYSNLFKTRKTTKKKENKEDIK